MIIYIIYFILKNILICIIKKIINLKKALNLITILGLNLLYNVLFNIVLKINLNKIKKVFLQKDVRLKEWRLIYNIQFLIFSHNFLHL